MVDDTNLKLSVTVTDINCKSVRRILKYRSIPKQSLSIAFFSLSSYYNIFMVNTLTTSKELSILLLKLLE